MDSNTSQNTKPISVVYRITVDGGSEETYTVRLDPKTLLSLEDPGIEYPDWTLLKYSKCDECPLDEEKIKYCPVAKNLHLVSSNYKDLKSYDKANIVVEIEERTFSKYVTLQDGLPGLFGLVMATSDCPHMSFLRSMARFHLPFSTVEETAVRSASLYLVTQYFKERNGETGDFKLTGLARLYAQVKNVNIGILHRVRSISQGDAELNSICNLDCFVDIIQKQSEDGFPSIEKYFIAEEKKTA